MGFLYKDHSPAGTTTVLWNTFLMGIPSRDANTTWSDIENNGLLRKSQINKEEKKILEKSNWIELWATREQYWIVRELNCLTLWKFIRIFLLKLWYHHAFWILDLTSSFTFSIYPSHSPNLNCIRTDRLVYTGENEGIMVIIMMMMRLWMIYCAEAKCLNFRDTLQTDQSAFSGN